MRVFASNRELFDAIVELAARLDALGQAPAAREIREGMACINGLTDGWGEFYAAAVAAERRFGWQLQASDREDLRAICEATRKAVYRR